MMQTSLAGSGPKYPALAVVWILLGVAVASAGVQDVYRLSLSTGRITTTLLAGLALVASVALCAVIAWNLHTGLRRWRTLGLMISALLAVVSGVLLPLLIVQVIIRRPAHWELLALMALIFPVGIKTFLALRAR